MITVLAYAKINLFLDILARLDNGYHSLFMLMQSIGLYDTVTLEKQDSIECICSLPEIPYGEKNLAFKAARAFFDSCKIENGGVSISIEKRIPSAAGLAGGSADAAAVIRGLDHLYGTRLSEYEMQQIGVKVGADVPFCISGGTMLSQNIGEVLSPIKPLPDCFIVLAKPASDVSTKEAYAEFDRRDKIARSDRVKFLSAASAGDFNLMCRLACNVFEQFIEVPERVEIKRIMRAHGSLCSQMSGSGPTVFGIFSDKSSAELCASDLKKQIKNVFVCSPVPHGTVIEESN